MATTFTQYTEQTDVSFQEMNDLTDEIATAIDNVLSLSLGANNQLLGIKAASLAAEWKTLSGTANQITITHAANSITLSTPQDIATASSPTFAGLTLTGDITATTAGGLNINLGTVAGDDFTIDTSAFVVEGDTGFVGISITDPGAFLGFKSTLTFADKIISFPLWTQSFFVRPTGTGGEMQLWSDLAGIGTVMTWTTAGNVIIGGTSVGANAERVLTLVNGAAPGALANTASIVSLSGELWGYDGGGTGTIQTPHPIEVMNKSDLAIPFPWGYHSKNPYLGKEVLLDWSVLVAEVEKLSGKTFAIYRNLPVAEKRSWATDQAQWIVDETEKLIAKERDKEIEVLDIMDALETVEITQEVDDLVTTTTKYEMDFPTKQIVAKTVVGKKTVGTGKYKTQLKGDCRIDEKTGKLWRKKTRTEAEAIVVSPTIPQPPKWMADRGVL